MSWQPTDLEVSAARRVIAYLEDRRVLYAPDSLEVPEHCVQSVLEIRHFLSGELGKLETGSEFAGSLRAMRAACRKFLDRVGTDGREVTLYANQHGHWASWTFYSAVGKMRGMFRVHLAKIAVKFRLDVEDRLAEILPARGDTAYAYFIRVFFDGAGVHRLLSFDGEVPDKPARDTRYFPVVLK